MSEQCPCSLELGVAVWKELDHHTAFVYKFEQTVSYTNVFEVLTAVDHLQVTSSVKLRCEFVPIVPVCTSSVL